MESEAIEVLLPKTKKIQFAGSEVEVKPLTLKQLFSAFNILREKKAKLTLIAGSDAEFVFNALEAAGDLAPQLMGVITGLEAEKMAAVGLDDVSELVLAVAEVNNFSKVFANFQKAKELLKAKK